MSTTEPGTSGIDSRPATEAPARLRKLPQITVLFWVITILIAGAGQATFDWLIGTGAGLPGLGFGGALGIPVALVVIGLTLQFIVRRYVAAVYWFAVFGVSVLGTLFADVLHFAVGLPLWATPLIFALILTVNFLLWYRADRTVSIERIQTRRRQVSYWVAALFIFALGTSLVDLVTIQLNAGQLASTIGFLVLLLVAAGLSIRFKGATVFLFWYAFIVIRPMSGSFSDWLIDSLGIGAGTVALVAGILIVVLVGYSTLTGGRKNQRITQVAE